MCVYVNKYIYIYIFVYIYYVELIIFRFPLNNSNRLQQWLNNFPLKNWQPSKDSLLCSDHFTEDCFDRTGFRVHLQPNSIPTKFGEARSLCVYCKRKKLYKSGLSFFRWIKFYNLQWHLDS